MRHKELVSAHCFYLLFAPLGTSVKMLINTLKNPVPDLRSFSAREVAKEMFKFYLLLMFVKMVLGLLLFKFFAPVSQIKDDKPYLIYLLILLPLFEELIFRLPLSLNRMHIRVSGFLMGLFGVALGLKYYEVKLWVALCLGLVIFLFVSWASNYSNGKSNRVRLFVFYTSAALFSIIHFYNYPELPLGAYTLIFIPHFLSGVIFGFFRLKFSLGHSIVMHYLVNLLPFIAFVTKNYI